MVRCSSHNRISLPKKIKIGCCTYTIKEIVVDSEEDFVGRCAPNKQIIEIDKRLSPDKKVQTLLHEILHAICFEQGHMKIAEHKIDILATGILAVIKDNPKLRKLILKETQ